METIIDTPSRELLAQLTRPSVSYKRSARLAVAGLLGFVLLYFALAGWFAWTAYRLGLVAWYSAENNFWMALAAACSAFFGVFMLNALLSIRSAMPPGLAEVTAQEQPRLFAFLYDLADAAGAPRPHRVFLSARVNAAVFYDLSLLNLIFPSRKNLEIGLPLVNAMPLGELRAVLAHEFGHFAQQSMAVGRWVYVARQVASHLVGRRDRFDDFLSGLARIDIRLRIFVWLPQLVVWSIRSLVDSAFRLVVMAESALSREMEMQADLVAVSLTGSDALVHALHRLRAADDAWGRTVGFVHGERAQGRATGDALAVQSHITQRMGSILDGEDYGSVPPLPRENRAAHRIFKPELAQPPKMWQSHPLSHEREDNAKRLYVAAEIDQASAWSLFDDAAGLRARMSAGLLAGEWEKEAEDTPIEVSLRKLGKYYRREQFHERYNGAYFGRSLARHAATWHALAGASRTAGLEEASSFYPPALRESMRQLRSLSGERGQLEALVAGAAQLSGGGVQLRGVAYRARELPSALAHVGLEIAAIEARLRAHDAQVRSWHLSMADQIGGGWRAYLEGLLALLHYAEHTEANLEDAHGLLLNVAGVVTAVPHVTNEGVLRVVAAANELHFLMEQVYQHRGELVLDPMLVSRLELEGNWQQMLGEFTLPMAGRENLTHWMDAIGGWVGHMNGTLTSLRAAALEQLLLTETLVAKHARLGAQPKEAPAPSRVPVKYALLMPGDERKRQTRLGLWARFLRAEGWLPGAARLLAAAAVVGLALGAGLIQSETTLLVYNGLGIPVRVTIDGRSGTVAPLSSQRMAVAPQPSHQVEARSNGGVLIERFVSGESNGTPVYNVAGAAPLVEWTAVYGKAQPVADRRVGAPRWIGTQASVLFERPPQSVSAKGPQRRLVLAGAAELRPGEQLDFLQDDAERKRVTLLHARWDDTQRPETLEWLQRAAADGAAGIAAERLRRSPDDVALLRMEQDASGGTEHDAVCARHQARADAAPDNGDLQYLALRCADGKPQVRAGWATAAQRWPNNGWLRNAVASDKVAAGDFAGAETDLLAAQRALPLLRPHVNLMLARIQRLVRGRMDYQALAPASPNLRALSELEDGYGAETSETRAYAEMNRGALAAALAMSGGTPSAARVLRLVAASDGAGPNTLQRALDLPPDQGIDGATVWPSIALAMRAGKDSSAYAAEARRLYGPAQPAVLGFLQAVQRGKPLADAEAMLLGLPLDARMQAYSAATVLAGPMAPAPWRLAAQRLLFAPERPYFR
jgi:Zn-dependent protease with chaperone function